MNNFTPARLAGIFVGFWLAVLFGNKSLAQPGCTDPLANNFSSAATVNDGSCTYNTTLYTPQVKVNPLNNLVNESSGLQWAGGFLWTFNDSEGQPAIYRIDTVTSTVLQTVYLEGATNVDWEDIAFDGSNLYIGDFGNQQTGDRTNLAIYKFALAQIPDYRAFPTATISTANIQILHFTYADQEEPPVSPGQFNTRFDCEAMIVDEGKIHLFTKNWVDLNTSHYVIDGLTAGTYIANKTETLPTGFLVTAADKVEGKNLIVLLGYQIPDISKLNFGNHFIEMLYGYNNTNYFSGNKRKINLPNGLTMGQAEGITFRSGGYGYISNEKVDLNGINVSSKLMSFNLDQFIAPSVLANELESFRVYTANGIHTLTWSFSQPVETLYAQYSVDGSRFLNLQTFNNSKNDILRNRSDAHTSYYRLAWKNKQADLQYSNIISVHGQQKEEIAALRLSRNGNLKFNLGSSNQIAFKVVDINGRILATLPPKVYLAGEHSILLGKTFANEQVVYITWLQNKEVITRPVKIF